MTRVSRGMGMAAAAVLAAGIASGQGRTGGGATATGAAESPAMGSTEMTAPPASSDSPDHSFAIHAAQGGLAEVEMGRIAAQNASSDVVRRFGQRMVDDHGKANDELRQIAAAKGIPLPAGLSGKEKKDVSRFQKMMGGAFDEAYMSDMVRDHEKDVADFEREARSGRDAELRAFAEKTLPTLKEHLRMAKDASAKAGAEAKKASS